MNFFSTSMFTFKIKVTRDHKGTNQKRDTKILSILLSNHPTPLPHPALCVKGRKPGQVQSQEILSSWGKFSKKEVLF